MIFPVASNALSTQNGNERNSFGRVHQVGPTVSDNGLHLNSGVAQSQRFPAQNPSGMPTPGICSCCLDASHAREACKSAIRCFACLNWGHVAVNCPGCSNCTSKGKAWRSKEKEVTVASKGKGLLEQTKPIALGTGMAPRPQPQSPPIFDSFFAWASAHPSSSPATPLSTPLFALWSATSTSMTGGPSTSKPHGPETELCLGRVPMECINPLTSLDNYVHRPANSENPPITRKPHSLAVALSPFRLLKLLARHQTTL